MLELRQLDGVQLAPVKLGPRVSTDRAGLAGVKLTLAYDGAGFAGWQVQPSQRTVQAVVEAAIAKLDAAASGLRSASRTDAGVHARGQVAAFSTQRTRWPARQWMLALNDGLPDDVAVMAAESCPADYHPRHDSSGKTYRYLLQLHDCCDPLWRKRAWYLGPLRQRDAARSLDGAAMRAAAEMLLGRHDFRAFQATRHGQENSERTLTHLAIEPSHAGELNLWSITVGGNAFLKHMVRILVGTLVDVGRHRMALETVPALLGVHAQRSEAGCTAPAHGLTLLHVALGRRRDL